MNLFEKHYAAALRWAFFLVICIALVVQFLRVGRWAESNISSIEKQSSNLFSGGSQPAGPPISKGGDPVTSDPESEIGMDSPIAGIVRGAIDQGLPIVAVGILLGFYRRRGWRWLLRRHDFSGIWVGLSNYDRELACAASGNPRACAASPGPRDAGSTGDSGTGADAREASEVSDGLVGTGLGVARFTFDVGPSHEPPVVTRIDIEQDLFGIRMTSGHSIVPRDRGISWESTSMAVEPGGTRLHMSYSVRSKRRVNAVEEIEVMERIEPSYDATWRANWWVKCLLGGWIVCLCERRFSVGRPRILLGRFERAFSGESDEPLYTGKTYYVRISEREKADLEARLGSSRSPRDALDKFSEFILGVQTIQGTDIRPQIVDTLTALAAPPGEGPTSTPREEREQDSNRPFGGDVPPNAADPGQASVGP